MKRPSISSPPAPGTFEDAELVQLRRVAQLTPAERIKMLCSMNKVARHLATQRRAAPVRPMSADTRRE